MKRRDFMLGAALAGGAGSLGYVGDALSSSATLERTPEDYTGPFYPKGPRHQTNDLVVGEPRSDVLTLEGVVVDVAGQPQSGLLFDLWQADPAGQYDHPRAQRVGETWAEFLYWGEAMTDEAGRFSFRTYVPGEYGARPAAHIHYRIWRSKQPLLTSQVYFEDLGGARGRAKSSAADRLQTTKLNHVDRGAVRCIVQVVI